MILQNHTAWDNLCVTLVQTLFRVEGTQNGHHNQRFPTGLSDATSKESAFFVEVGP